MPRRPGDMEPEPPGGRAAERLREFTEQRFPGETPELLPSDAETAKPASRRASQKGKTVKGKKGAPGGKDRRGS